MRHNYPAAINLRWLNGLRLIAIAGQTLTVIVVHWGMDITLPLQALVLTIGALGLVAIITWLRLSFITRQVTDIELFTQLSMDIAALSVLFYWTGGWTNPFVSLYLLPVSIGANILPIRMAWGLAALALAAYTLLIQWHHPLSVDPHMMHGFWVHALGMWFTFAISALLIVYVITYMIKALRERDQRLAEFRERNLRNEQIMAIATLAASAAHELATPLSTIAVITNELDTQVTEEGHVELNTLRTQVERCKAILQELRTAASASKNVSVQTLVEILSALQERWQVLFPKTELVLDIDPAVQNLELKWDRALDFALMNLLSNAEAASPGEIVLSVTSDNVDLRLDVLDRGLGLDANILHKLGDQIITTKGNHGHGLGLLLTNATIERFDGSVHLLERKGGGLIARVRLPLKELETSQK